MTPIYSDDPDGSAAWEVWYRDSFDRETPPKVEVKGQGLLMGLTELWARYLYETVQPDGSRGFSYFYLIWKQRQKQIEINDTDIDLAGSKRLRDWIFGSKTNDIADYVNKANDRNLLNAVAHSHARLVLLDKTCHPILDLARANPDSDLFRANLKTIVF